MSEYAANSKGPLVGIDLGTTNSVVASIDRTGLAQAIPDDDGARILPSAVYFPRSGDPLVGAAAKSMAAVDPMRAAQAFKRGMGERTFRADGSAFVVEGKEWRPEELSGMVLTRLRLTAEAFFEQPLGGAVVTVPAYFGDAERKATIAAGEIAGLDVMRVINEPTAAAIANGLDDTSLQGLVLVFDLGGGTFDVTLMEVSASRELVAKGTGGDHQLGGIDFDNLILRRMAEVCRAELGTDLQADMKALADAQAKAEEMKKELSRSSTSRRQLTVGGRSLSFTLTRDEFEALLEKGGYLQDLDDHVMNVLDDSGVQPSDLSAVLLVGGSSRIPILGERLERLTKIRPVSSRNPDEDVARGAAMVAAKTAQADSSPGGALAILDSASPLALMPAPQDVASRGLGHVVLDDDDDRINEIVIPAGTPVPSKHEVHNTAASDNQTGLRVQLTEGDSEDLEFVRVLGESVGSFGRPVRKGHPIRVTMEYTADQLIICQAYDGETGAFITEVQVNDGGMSDDDRAEAKEQLARFRL